jgi:AmmeMemoRadiSam system protein B
LSSDRRRAVFAGSWYAGDPAALARDVAGYIRGAGKAEIPGRLIALISPHAGLCFSGPVAAYGYALLEGHERLRVVMVGPSHRVAFAGAAVASHGAWATPLGDVPIDAGMARAILSADPELLDAPELHREEHSLEIQLPFLRYLVKDLEIVPIMMGSQESVAVDRLSRALAQALAGRDALLLASSDLSHFNPARIANVMDARVVEEIERFDADGLMRLLSETPEHACGGGPIVAVMKAARALGADRATVLRYADSGDVEDGDKQRVVGYVSAALWASGGASQ